MDKRPNTETGQPQQPTTTRNTAMGTMTMAPRAVTSGMGSGISLPPLMEVLGDYYRTSHNDNSRFHMPRRFPERESPISSRRTPPLPTIASITSILDPTSASPPSSKRRITLNSPLRRPISLTRPSAKRPATDDLERESAQTTVRYPAVNPPANIDQRRHSNISSISHPETPLPPVSTITTSRGSSSEAERHAAPLSSFFPHTQPPTPLTSGSRYPYDPDYPSHQHNPSPYYRHSGEQHPSYHPPSPPSHPHYSPPHHPPLLTQPYPSTRTGMYMPRPAQSASTQDRTPFSSSIHGGIEGYDQGSSRIGAKRRRGNLPKHVTDTLRTWLTNHVAHPYPTEEEKQQLCQITGLNMNQISNWFINARRRKLPQQRNDADPHLLGQPRNTSPPRPSPSLGHARSHSHDAATNILPPPLPPSQQQGPYNSSGR